MEISNNQYYAKTQDLMYKIIWYAVYQAPMEHPYISFPPYTVTDLKHASQAYCHLSRHVKPHFHHMFYGHSYSNSVDEKRIFTYV